LASYAFFFVLSYVRVFVIRILVISLLEDNAMKRLVMAAVVAACVGTVGPAKADDKDSLTGTWEWIVHRDKKTGVATVELKLEGNRITGVMHGRSGKDMKVENGTFKDGQVSFEVPAVNPDGSKMVHRYKGTLTGDTIVGKAEIEIFGRSKHSMKWLAQRYVE
jgi:hypothetical protein